jgi:diguanylate cyclase (GGDEF)-like protein
MTARSFPLLVGRLSSRRHRTPIAVAATASAVAVALLDLWTGPDLSLALLYLIPVMAMAWVLGLKGGIPMALGCGVAGLSAYLLDPGSLSLPVGLWNSVVRTGTFLLVAWLAVSQKALLEVHHHAAMTDGLTGTMTRRAFYHEGARLLRRAARDDVPVSLIYADLDRLKETNDLFGHEAGDEMIVHFAKVARTVLRTSDLLARIGGDEFVILMAGTNAREAVDVGERLAARLLEDTSGAVLSASMGIVNCLRVSGGIEQLVREADDAMYEAKHTGGAAIRLRVNLTIDEMGTAE